jgi:hypothetical protein
MKKIILCLFMTLPVFGAIAQKKQLSMPDDGFWELISRPGQPRTTVVQFYDTSAHLLYEEQVKGVRFNLHRTRTRARLNEMLEKVLKAQKSGSQIKLF